MAKSIPGTNVASAIRPFTEEDKFATAYANEIKGGLHNYQALEELFALPKDRREIYMFCAVGEDLYQLIRNPDTETTDFSCWKKIDFNNENMIIDDTEVNLSQYLSEMNIKASTKYFQFVNYVYEDGTMAGIEILCPFSCKLNKITSVVPVDTTLSRDIVMNCQYFATNVWNTVTSVTINASTKEGTAGLAATAINIPAGSRLRMLMQGTTTDKIDTISTVLEVVQTEITVQQALTINSRRKGR